MIRETRTVSLSKQTWWLMYVRQETNSRTRGDAPEPHVIWPKPCQLEQYPPKADHGESNSTLEELHGRYVDEMSMSDGMWEA